MRETVYESDDVKVVADLFDDAKGIIVGLSEFSPELHAAAFGDGAVQKKGYCGIFVRAKTNHWWQIPDRAELCRAVKDVSGRFGARLAYGSSMGGYGALSLGSEMGCNRILAVAPQTIVSNPEISMNPDWRAAIATRPILRDDVAAELSVIPEIFYDPYSADDVQHVHHLRDRRRLREYKFPFAGHKLLVTLNQCGIIGSFISKVFSGNYDARELDEMYTGHCHLSSRYHLNAGIHHATIGDHGRAREHLAELEKRGDELSVKLKKAIARTQPRDQLTRI